MKASRVAWVTSFVCAAIAACTSDEASSPATDVDASIALDASKDGTTSAEGSTGTDAATADAPASDSPTADSPASDAPVSDAPESDGDTDGTAPDANVPVVAGCITGIFGHHYIRTDGHVLNGANEVHMELPDGGAGAVLDGIVEGMEGSHFACARKNDGTAWCWATATGYPSSGQIGDGTFVWPKAAYVAHQVVAAPAVDGGAPVPITDAVSLMRHTWVTYGSTACLVRSDKTAWCWGTVVSPFGSPKMITSAPNNNPVAAAIPIVTSASGPALANVEEISVGLRHVCAITSDSAPRDSVYCWGGNIYNEIGDTLPDASSAVSRPFPTKLTRLPAGNHHHMAAGPDETCVMVDDKAYCWGANDYGQAGTGAPQSVQPGCFHVCENRDPAPPVLEGPPDGAADAGTPLTGLTVLHGGYDFNCALGAADALYCWGDNKGGVDGNTYRMASKVMLGANPAAAKFVTSTSGSFTNVTWVALDGGYFIGQSQQSITCP